MSEFKIFAKNVNNTLTQLQKNEMYITEASGEEIQAQIEKLKA